MTIVVSDTSPLNYLLLCKAIDVLPALFGDVMVPPAVLRELQSEDAPDVVRAWLEASPSSNRPSLDQGRPGTGRPERRTRDSASP